MTDFHFGNLLPEMVLDAVSAQGWRPTGVLMPLNSYENRVYQIGIDDAEPLVVKFYRPERWSLDTIRDEHRFLQTLAAAEVPVVLPLPLPVHLGDCATIGQWDNLYYTVYPKFRGKERDELTNDDRRWLGRLLGRLHNIGAHFTAPHRLRLNPQTYGTASLDFILRQPFLPEDLRAAIATLLQQALDFVTPHFPDDLAAIPLHGDCHHGNVLWNHDGPHLVDFDDMVVAAPVQDVWMLFSGDATERAAQQEAFFTGYELFRPFDRASLRLAEPLRTLRMIRHAAWIGQRYHEPAFQRAFPYYEQRRYWEEFLLAIKEQIAVLQELQWSSAH
ncbi:MAG: serine/threonine protein kinase [Deltaproteobacteria bacterium]|nr:serine/threonine protein kinase [Deltaproteobacteria bacterium]